MELVDGTVGELIDYLESEGLLEDAVVVLTADHGEALGEGHILPVTPRHLGNPSFEQVLQVPLIITRAKLEVESDLVRSEDLFQLMKRLIGLSLEGG
jgi:arylsulfatase A-like enzyme